MKKFFKLTYLTLAILILVAILSALAAANVVVESGVDLSSHSIGADDLKPPQCNAISLADIVSGSGVINGTAANELVLGSSIADIIDGMDGDDCIVSGAGDDTLDGGNGTDICIGGAGVDTFLNCETVIDP